MKDELIRGILAMSAGTIATFTGETKYSVIDVITEKALELAKEISEDELEAMSNEGKIPYSVYCELFVNANNERRKAV